MPLEVEDRQHLTVAEGYAELGMYLDAQEELENIEPGCGMCLKCWQFAC
jgi:hypothetical protein